MHRVTSVIRLKGGLLSLGRVRRQFVSVASSGQQEISVASASTSERRANTMRAWHTVDGSGQLQCQDNLPRPAIRCTSDVLVEVYAASINPLDVAMLKGYGDKVFGTIRCLESVFVDRPNSTSHTLGRDFSGVIREVGWSGKRQFQPGDEVVGVIAPQRKDGSHAQYILASSNMLAKKPKSLSHTEAASLPYAGLTAWSAVRCFGGIRNKNVKGRRALVLGASGGVGTIAIQLLKAYGCQVTTVVKGDAIQLVLGLGADEAIDYSQPDWEKYLGRSEKYDVILNCTKNLSSTYGIHLLKSWKNSSYVHTTPPLLRNIDAHGWPRGLLHSAAEFGFDAFKGIPNGQFYNWAYVLPIKSGLDEIINLADAGKIKPVVEAVFPFDSVQQAFDKVQSGHARGKTIIDMNVV